MGKSKLINNILVTVSGKFGVMFIQLLTTIVLSRFLLPEDFGIIAMCTIFISLSDMLVDSGMAGSIIFFRDVKDIELHTLFWTNFFVACSLYIILYFTSSSIATFYGVPILDDIIQVIALSTVIHSLCIMQSTILSKQLKFKLQSKILLFSAIASSIVVICIGYFHGGVWTLVWQAVLIKVFQAILFFIYGDYRPKFQYSLKELKRHWNFGSKLLGISLLKLVYDNIYVQLIGRVVNLKDAGLYTQAKRFNDVPSSLISFPLERVIFPTLVSMDDRETRMKQIYKGFTVILIPVLLLGALVSNEVIWILLGDNWKESGPILSYLFVGTIGLSLESLNRNFIKVTGQTTRLLKSEVLKRVLNVIVILIACYWSLKGIVFAFIFNGFLGWIINSIILEKVIKSFTFKEQILRVLSSIVLSGFPFVLLWYLFTTYTTGNILVDLLIKCISYVLIYLLLLAVFERGSIMALKAFLKKRKR